MKSCFLKVKEMGDLEISVPRNPRDLHGIILTKIFGNRRLLFHSGEGGAKNLASVHQSQVKCGDSAGEVEMSSFITLLGNGGHSGPCLEKLCLCVST